MNQSIFNQSTFSQTTATHTWHRLMVLFSFAVITLTSGCVTEKEDPEPRINIRPMVNAIEQAEQDWIWISAEQWQLSSIEGNSPIKGTVLRINFKQHTWLDGDAGCNRFTASYIRKAEAGLKVTEILSTRMYCAEPTGIMQQESRFFNLLKQIDAYNAEPEKLNMLADGDVVLSFTIYKENDLSRTDDP